MNFGLPFLATAPACQVDPTTFAQQMAGGLQELLASEELTDAAFSIYYFVGFISGPVWTLIIGYVMQHYGFTQAFYVAAGSYIAGMVLLLFVSDEAQAKQPA